MKTKSSRIIFVLTLVLIILTIRLAFHKYNDTSIHTTLDMTKTKSGFALEPDTPINMKDPPFYSLAIPSNEVSVSEVLEKGNDISIQFIYNNPDWERPAYKDYWHSQYGRWSYVPNRIHYALHQVFSTYATASRDYDFIHNVGIAEESEDFTDNGLASPLEHIQVVAMNFLVEQVVTYQNQIVLVGTPQRTGLQALLIPTSKLNPKQDTKNLLIQLVTPDGYEIDYTTVEYISPEEIPR